MADKKSSGSKPRRRLGRGLQSLLTDPIEVPVSPPARTLDASTAAAEEQNTNKQGQAEADARPDTARDSAATFAAPVRPAAGPVADPAPVDDAGPASVGGPVGGVVADEHAVRDSGAGRGPAPAAEQSGAVAAAVGGDGTLLHVALGALRPNPDQPRRRFDEDALAALAESIRTAGLMQPIVVRPRTPAPGQGPGSEAGPGAVPEPSFEIVAGERRFRAASRIPLETVPVLVREIDDRTAAEFALIENLQREDLNPIERAIAFRRLTNEFAMTHEAVAEAVGLDRASVSNHLRLLGLDEATLEDVQEGRLGMGHGRALLAVDAITPRRSLAEQAIRDGWSVRELERRIRAFIRKEADTSPADDSADPDLSRSHLDDLERRLGEHLGTRVQVRPGRRKGSGEVRIQFFSHEDFEGLLDRVGFKVE
jgi:ParB family chromosome partitioning protein